LRRKKLGGEWVFASFSVAPPPRHISKFPKSFFLGIMIDYSIENGIKSNAMDTMMIIIMLACELVNESGP
jgi:hypothetical protein